MAIGALRKALVVVIGIVLLLGGGWILWNREGIQDGTIPWETPSQVVLRLSIADSPAKQSKGLGGVPFLADDEGMLFLFKEPFRERTFWMKEMLIPIDIVWIGLDGRVLGVEESIQPPSYPQENLALYRSPGPVRAVLEVPAWQARSLGIEVGTHLVDLFELFP